MIGGMGCSIDEKKIEGWERTHNGHKRLTGFLADQQREMHLRVRAARVLMRMGRFGDIMHVVASAPPPQKTLLVTSMADIVHSVLTKDRYDQDERMQAAGFAFYLFEHFGSVQGGNAQGPRSKQLVEDVVGWSLEQLKLYEKLPKGPRSFKDILVSAAMVSPDWALPMIYNFMRTPPDVSRLLVVNQVLTALKDPAVRKLQAGYLLAYARTTYPKLDPRLAEAMLANRNETLLRFLLDTVRDYRAPLATREKGLLAAKLLKTKALEGLYLILRTDDPKNDNIARLNALDLIWDFAGSKGLSRALQSLPPTGSWWPTGVNFKAQVDEFCEAKLAPAAEEVRPTLVALVDDPNWVTRTYAMGCIIKLFPDEAPILLASLADDDTTLEGWVNGGMTTIGSVVAELGPPVED
jgi:hypothetical protein